MILMVGYAERFRRHQLLTNPSMPEGRADSEIKRRDMALYVERSMGKGHYLPPNLIISESRNGSEVIDIVKHVEWLEENSPAIQLLKRLGIGYSHKDFDVELDKNRILSKEEVAMRLEIDTNGFWGKWKLNRLLKRKHSVGNVDSLRFKEVDENHYLPEIKSDYAPSYS